MRDSIFVTITKWWCNCLDLCFEIVARPWKPEELLYRRMLCTIFGQSWKLRKSYKIHSTTRKPSKTYKETREQLVAFTRAYWESMSHEMTPAWPDGATEYLSELFEALFIKVGTETSTVTAFAAMHGTSSDQPPKCNELGYPVGDPDDLQANLDRLIRQFRRPDIAILIRPFALADFSENLSAIVKEWSGKIDLAAWDDALHRGEVPKNYEDISVESLELSVRSYNCLKNANLHTVGDLLRTSETELLRKKDFGRKSLNEVKEILSSIHPAMKIGMLYGK